MMYPLLRPRLDELLHRATDSQIVYVIAGAGYGKTQAVRHYTEQQKDAVVRWMQLTESDNMGSRFWESLAHTVAMDNPGLAVKLREFGFPKTLARFKQFSILLKRYEHQSRKLFFVLDEFHLIHSKEMLAFVERCTQLPLPGVCMLILSRQEPKMAAASLFTKGQYSVITEDDLRFTAAEAAAFFRQQKTPVSAQNLAALLDATKGWAMAISMFSLILKRTPNNFNYALNSVRQNIFHLLELEVWADFPEHVQKAIVKLSLVSNLPIMSLHEISGDLAFIQNTPGLGSFIWFRSFTNDLKIHPLYLEFLQSKRQILSHDEKQAIYRWAAQWCSAHDFYMDAMYYYAQSRQFDQMIQILLSHPLKLPHDSSEHFLSILRQLESIKEEQSNPSVILLQKCFVPLLLIGAGEYNEAQERSLAVAREWEDADSPFATLLLYITYSNLAYIDMYTCTVTHKYNSPRYLQKAIDHLKRASFPPAETSVAFINADTRSFACLVGEGAALKDFDLFLEAAQETSPLIAQTPHNIYAGYADLAACEYAFFKNQPVLARNHAHNAILKAKEKQQYSVEAMAENYLLRIATQEGNAPLVKKLLKQLQAHLDNPDFWNRQLYYDLYVGLFYAQIGLLEVVPHWLVMDEKETALEISMPAREAYVSAKYYIAAQKYQQALIVLSSSYPREPQERFLFGELRLLLLTAIARIHTGDASGAMADFKRAYELSFQGEFEQFFIELGKELHPFVVTALKQADCGIPAEWLKTMERKASIYTKKLAVVANAFQTEAQGKEAVSLSARESEVLLDLYHGLSREEIAANRYLSINTVKKTLQSIYIKLGAQNNVDAIRIALEKKLIE